MFLNYISLTSITLENRIIIDRPTLHRGTVGYMFEAIERIRERKAKNVDPFTPSTTHFIVIIVALGSLFSSIFIVFLYLR